MGCDNLGSFTLSFSTSMPELSLWKLAAEHKIVNNKESHSFISRGSKLITYSEFSLNT